MDMDLTYCPMNRTFEEGYLEPGSLTAITIENSKVSNPAVVFSGPNVVPLKIHRHDLLWFWMVIKDDLTRRPTDLIDFAPVFTRTVKKIDPSASDDGIDELDAMSKTLYELYNQAQRWEAHVFPRNEPSDLQHHLIHEMRQKIVSLVMKYFSTEERLAGLFRLASDSDDSDTLSEVCWILGFLIKALRQKYFESARDIASGAENVQLDWWGRVAKVLLKQDLKFGQFTKIYEQRLARYQWNLAREKAYRIKHGLLDDEEADDGVDLSWYDNENECKLPNPEDSPNTYKIQLIKFMCDLIMLFAAFEVNITGEQVEEFLENGKQGWQGRMYGQVGELVIASGIPMLHHAVRLVERQRAASNNIFA